MKKLFVLMMLCIVYSVSAQKTKAIIYFKDGTQKEGYGKLAASNSVKFKESKKGEVKKYTRDDLESVKIYTDEGIEKYVYVKIENINNSMLVNEVLKGKLSLYKETQYNYNRGGFGMGASGMAFGIGSSYKTTQYFLLKEGQNEAVNFGKKGGLVTKNFKKVVKESLDECPGLVKKVESGEFKRRDIVEMVEFYNQNCSE